MNLEIANYWSRIEQWLTMNMPPAQMLLPQGVSPGALIQAESLLGFEIPGELKEFLLIHDGSGILWLHDYGEFMSLKQIISAWDMEVDLWDDGENDEWAKPSGPIKKRWFTRDWLPVLDARTGDYACIDLDPAEGGTSGQIINWRHDGGPGRVIATSFGNLLDEFVKELDLGFYKPGINRKGQPYLKYIKGS